MSGLVKLGYFFGDTATECTIHATAELIVINNYESSWEIKKVAGRCS